MFIHPKDEELTLEELLEFIDEHQTKRSRFKELQKQYESEPPILDMEGKEPWKPDNRLVVNYAKYIIDIFNGYFTGIPIKLSHENEQFSEALNHFWNRNDMDDTLSELSKLTSIYGVGYLYVWQDEESHTRVTYNSPFDMFVICDDSIECNPKYGVRYAIDEDGAITGTLITLEQTIKFDESNFTDEEPHYYPVLPIIEFVENDEQQSLIRPVESLVNAYNKAISEKANDTDYFADAYLAILGAELDEEGTHKIRDNRIINMYGTDEASRITVEFLNKPDGDVTQENLLNRLERLIYQLSMVANINDESFGNASGVSLEFKLQPMKNLAATKERKFTKGLNKLFRCFTALPTNIPAAQSDEWINIDKKFTRNIPRNVQDEAQTARNLEGVVSRETQLGVLSIVDNVQEELDRIEAEESYSGYDERDFPLEESEEDEESDD